MDWISEKFEAVIGFFVGAVGAVFVGGRAYQKIQSRQDRHEEQIEEIMKRHDEHVKRYEASTSELFRTMRETRDMVGDVRVSQSDIAATLKAMRHHMDQRRSTDER